MMILLHAKKQVSHSHICSDYGSGTRPASKFPKICQAPGAPGGGPPVYMPIFTCWESIWDLPRAYNSEL